MRYTLLLHYVEATPEEVGVEEWNAAEAAFGGYIRSLTDAGVLVAAEVLQPSENSTTLRLRDGKPQVQDGPFADTKEQLGGIFILDLPDLDAALAWAHAAYAARTSYGRLLALLAAAPATSRSPKTCSAAPSSRRYGVGPRRACRTIPTRGCSTIRTERHALARRMDRVGRRMMAPS